MKEILSLIGALCFLMGWVIFLPLYIQSQATNELYLHLMGISFIIGLMIIVITTFHKGDPE